MENLERLNIDEQSDDLGLTQSIEITQPTLLEDVWDYLNEHNSRDNSYGGNTYRRWLREDIRKEYLPEMVRKRFSGRQSDQIWYTNRKLPQNFQHEVFGYLTEDSASKFGALRRITYEDVDIDFEQEADLQGIYYGVKCAIAILDRVQTPDFFVGYDVFPQVRAATINSAINDGVFDRQWGASFVDDYLEDRVINPRDLIAQQVGKICARNHAENNVLRSICDYRQFVNASVVSTQLIIEQLALQYYSNNVPRRTSC